MRHALAIARRELESYFYSPIAYAVLAIVTFVSGLFFTNMLVYYMRQSGLADAAIQRYGYSKDQLDVPTVVLANFFQNEAFLIMFAIPLLTMGLITDERRRGTLELLMTSPVRGGEIVMGKFVGAFTFLAVLLLPILPMFVFMGLGGTWELGIIASGMIGLLLVGGAQLALGLWISSLCENVLVSAIGTYGLLLTMQFIDTTSSAHESIWIKLVSYLSFYMRHMNSTRGVMAIADIVYFASFITLGLFLAQRSIEAIRFKRT